MHISCIFHAYFMHISCIFINIMYVQHLLFTSIARLHHLGVRTGKEIQVPTLPLGSGTGTISGLFEAIFATGENLVPEPPLQNETTVARQVPGTSGLFATATPRPQYACLDLRPSVPAGHPCPHPHSPLLANRGRVVPLRYS